MITGTEFGVEKLPAMGTGNHITAWPPAQVIERNRFDGFVKRL